MDFPAELKRQIAEREETTNQLKSRWEAEKQALSGIKPLKENIERLRTSFQQAFSRAQQTLRNEDFVEAQRTEQELKEAEKQLQVVEVKSAELNANKDNRLLREEVTDEDIAKVVSLWTNIPVSRMMQGEREKLLRMEDEIHKRMINQHEAVEAVSDWDRCSEQCF